MISYNKHIAEAILKILGGSGAHISNQPWVAAQGFRNLWGVNQSKMPIYLVLKENTFGGFGADKRHIPQ